MNNLYASGHQLVIQLYCALREIDLRRAGGSPTQVTADSNLPVDPPIIYEVIESGSCREVISCTETTSAAADAPATKATPQFIPLTHACRTMTVSATVTQEADSSPPRRSPPKTEKFTGAGNRLGGGGKYDGDDDDGNNPNEWRVADDGRDGNAKKKEDDEGEKDDDLPDTEDASPSLPLVDTTGTDVPGPAVAPFGPTVTNLLGPRGLPGMPSGVAVDLAYASPPPRDCLAIRTR